jgi:hypothetical protein
MTTIVWNPNGFHIVKALLKWSKFNADYYINNILVAISDWRRLTGERGKTSYGSMLTTLVRTPQSVE